MPLSGKDVGIPGEGHRPESLLCICYVALGKFLNHASPVSSSGKWGQ